MQNNSISIYLRITALSAAALSIVYIINNFLIFWWGWPGLNIFSAHLGLFGLDALRRPLTDNQIIYGSLQVLLYFGTIVGAAIFVLRTRERSLIADSESLNSIVRFIIRSAFWAVLFIGLADMVISFLRVEGLLVHVVSEDLAKGLGRSAFRGLYVHYPLLIASWKSVV